VIKDAEMCSVQSLQRFINRNNKCGRCRQEEKDRDDGRAIEPKIGHVKKEIQLNMEMETERFGVIKRKRVRNKATAKIMEDKQELKIDRRKVRNRREQERRPGRMDLMNIR
jgi:hypothetical protein